MSIQFRKISPLALRLLKLLQDLVPTIHHSSFNIHHLTILLLFVSFSNASAQKNDFAKWYEQGKTEMKNKDFTKAMESFKKVANENPNNPYRINASYFYAYCSLKNKQYWSANHYLNKIIDKNPTWNKIGEAYYLMAQMSFEKHEYSLGVMWSQKIVSKFMKADVDNMKWNFLYFPSLKDTVAEINRKFPTDTCSATILYYLYKNEGGWKNKRAAKKLEEEYGIQDPDDKEKEKEKEVPKEPEGAVKPPKDTLSIAVLLPFNLKENIVEGEIKKDLYLFDLYSGMRIATDSMRKAGAKIRLVAYDYGKDSSDFCNFIDKPELTQYDVILGPLQNSVAYKVNKFAQTNNILVINPLSTNLKFTEGSENVFLFKTSPETQAKQAAQFAFQNFRPRKALVLTSKSIKDSTVASIFQTKYDSLGGKVLGKLTLTVGTLAKMDNFFSKKTLDSTGIIFVSTRDQFLGASIVRKLTELDRTNPLLVFPEWMDFQTVSYDQMKTQNIHFLGADYLDFEDDTVAAIRRTIKKRTHSYPSIYTYTGFEAIYQLAQLSMNDPLFFTQPNLKGTAPRPGLLFKGLDFKSCKDNKLFAIQRFTEEGFVEVK